MKQSALNQSVARATGESVRRIRQIGFSLLVVPPTEVPPESPRRPVVHRARPGNTLATAGRCA
jgi:hypothetical protein